jgi:Flp pilus assembly protein TadD
VCFSGEGKRIASASVDQTVKVWDAQTGQETLSLKGHTNSVTSVCFSPNGRRIASASLDGTVKVWDAQTGQEALSLKGHTGPVTSVCFSPNGRRIASASWDQTVKVWDAQTGQETLSLKGHTSWVLSVCFSPDGKRLISADVGGVRVVWDIAAEKVLPGATDPIATPGHRSPDGKIFAHIQGNVIRLLRLRPPTAEELAEGRRWVEPDFTWHAAEARSSEAAGQWFAAAFHLDRLLPSRPWDAGLHARLAYARTRLGQPQPAMVHYLHALTLNPHARLWPSVPGASRRGEAAAASGDWPAAAAEFRLAAHQPDARWADWHNLLLAQGAARQKDASRQTIALLLDRFEDKPAFSRQLVLACRVSPCEPAAALRLVKVAERLVAGKRDTDTLTGLGSAQYRGGRFEDATRTLRDAITIHGKGGDADAWLFLALAHKRLGHHDEAREAFDKLDGWYNKQRFQTWQERVRQELLHQEAKALVNAPPPMPRVNPDE